MIPSHVGAYQRRGSVPCESNVLSRNSVNGKRRNPKKVLRRRSSSGAEILTPIMSESLEPLCSTNIGSSTWSRFRRELTHHSDTDVLMSRRRGSLPTDVLAIGLGKLKKLCKSSTIACERKVLNKSQATRFNAVAPISFDAVEQNK